MYYCRVGYGGRLSIARSQQSSLACHQHGWGRLPLPPKYIQNAGPHPAGLGVDHQHKHLAGVYLFCEDCSNIHVFTHAKWRMTDHWTRCHVSICAVNNQPAVFSRHDHFGADDPV